LYPSSNKEMNGYTSQINYQPEMLAKINLLLDEVKRIRTELETLKLSAIFPPPPSSPLRRNETYAMIQDDEGLLRLHHGC